MSQTACDAALRERLLYLTQKYSQAEIARRTARSRNALTRYAQGARPPLEFGCALCAQLGVNPGWLLTGEGPAWAADVPRTATESGQGLLVLVQNIMQVARARLGALSGRDHARKLREISDSLDMYGSLRDRLNAVTVPLLREMLGQMEQALRAQNYSRARAIGSVAQRVEQLCDDRKLAHELIGHRCHLERVADNVDESLRLQSLHFRQTLDAQSDFSAIAASAYNLSSLHFSNGAVRDALRILNVAKAYAEGDEAPGDQMRLACQEALCLIELGRLGDVSPLLDRAYALCPPGERRWPDQARTRARLFGGEWHVAELSGAQLGSAAAGLELLNFACLAEDPGVIAAVLKSVGALVNPDIKTQRAALARARLLLAVLKGSKAPTDETGRTLAELAAYCQLHRLAGARRAGLELARQVQARLDVLPPRQQAPLTVLALHWRNVLHLVPAKEQQADWRALREKAALACKKNAAAGYGLFRTLWA